MREFVHTDQGSGWVSVVHVVRSGSISYLAKDAVLRTPDKPDKVLPEGTFLRRDDRLTRQTAKKPRAERRTHQIIEEGVHHAIRQCRHIRRSESGDGAEMLQRLPQMERIAQDLYGSGQLELKFHEEIKQKLAYCREQSFNDRKTNPKKIEVREHIDTAAKQRAKSGKLKAMPASAAVRASKRDIEARLQEIAGIHGAFGAHCVALSELALHTYTCVDAVWTLFGPNGTTNHPIKAAMYHVSRHRITINIALVQVRSAMESLKAVRILPYLSLARTVRQECRTLHWAIENCRRKQVDESLERIRYLLRRMRMLWYIECSLIEILSFLPDDGTVPAKIMEIFRDRLGKAETRVHNMNDAEFDTALREMVRDAFEMTRNHLKDANYDRAHEELKDLTKDLRVQPVHPVPRRKAA